MPEPRETRYSLIEKAINLDDHEAWQGLFSFYGKFIYGILIKVGVEESDRDDVVQETMLALTKCLSSYDKERGKFRHWFAQVVRNQATNHFRSKSALKRKMVVTHSDAVELNLYGVPAEVEAAILEEWEVFVAEKALENLTGRLGEVAIGVFRDSLKGATVEELMKSYDIKEGSVYNYRSRVRKAVIREVQHLVNQYEM